MSNPFERENYTVVIVEDEDRSRKLLENLLAKYCPNINIVGHAETVAEAVEVISQQHPDLVFLDVELPDGTGFRVLDQLPNLNFDVIFVTAYEHYALKAIKRAALDYLLKPLDIDDLVVAVSKLSPKNHSTPKTLDRQSAIMSGYMSNARDKSILALPTTDGLVFIQDSDIIVCKSDSNYTHLAMLNNRKFLVSRTLTDIEEMLSEDVFCRVHHSFIVNLKHVRRYFKGKGGYLEMSDGSTVEVSSRKKQDFLARFA